MVEFCHLLFHALCRELGLQNSGTFTDVIRTPIGTLSFSSSVMTRLTNSVMCVIRLHRSKNPGRYEEKCGELKSTTYFVIVLIGP